MTNKWCSITNFMNSIVSLLEDVKQVNVYFDDFNEGKFNWSIKPIGYKVIENDNSIRELSYADVYDFLPDMQYIQFKESKGRDMSSLSKTKKRLYKLAMSTEESSYKGHTYYESWVREANQDIYKTMLKKFEEDKKNITNEIIEEACKYIDLD